MKLYENAHLPHWRGPSDSQVGLSTYCPNSEAKLLADNLKQNYNQKLTSLVPDGTTTWEKVTLPNGR